MVPSFPFRANRASSLNESHSKRVVHRDAVQGWRHDAKTPTTPIATTTGNHSVDVTVAPLHGSHVASSLPWAERKKPPGHDEGKEWRWVGEFTRYSTLKF